MIQTTKQFLLKDMLFNKENVTHLANKLKSAYPKLNQDKFIKSVLSKFPELELKDRMHWIRENIELFIKEDYETTVQILLAAIKGESEEDSFPFGAFAEYVAKNGCNKEHLTLSLDALGEMTKTFSSEFAIRPFITNFPEHTYKKFQYWSTSKNHHQRRFASEGLRPKLPWASAIVFDYKKGATILDNLYTDNERYVTRSVANHLNDVSKLDPDLVVDILARWKNSNKQSETEMNYIINHALRTSMKRGHQASLKFLGYHTNPQITVSQINIMNPIIKLNDYLNFSFTLTAQQSENLLIDYKITYPTPSKKESTKVFKLKSITLKKGDDITIEKKHLFKLMSTKRLYHGTYKIELQINGNCIEEQSFRLKK